MVPWQIFTEGKMPFRQCSFGDLGNKIQRAVFRPLDGAMKGKTFIRLPEDAVIAGTGEYFNAVSLEMPQQVVKFENDQLVETLLVEIPN